jgi:KUP system potassium uptake protein
MALRANVERNGVLHQNVIVLTVTIDRVPHAPDRERLEADDLGDPADGIMLMTALLGYHDTVDIPNLLRLATSQGLLERGIDLDHASYFISRTSLVRTGAPGLNRWRKRLFVGLWRNSASPVEFFRLPQERTVTIGEPVEI